MKDFFISYTKADQAWAEWIAWQLENVGGYTTVIQAWDFHAGSNFISEMHKSLVETHCTIAVFSPAFLTSIYTEDEWTASLAKRQLIMVRVDEVDPPGLLTPLVYIDLVGLEDHEASDQLLKKIKRERAKPDKPPVYPGSEVSEQTPRPRYPGSMPPVCNIPVRRNPNFTGRSEYLSRLEKELNSGHHAALTQAISGMGGIGKTQIAIEYAYRYSTNYQAIWWIKAEDEKTLAADYAAFAAEANLPAKDAPEELVVINAVRNWLEHNRDWLLIFDNAANPEVVIDYLPSGANGHVLITSRHKAWKKICQPLRIDVWSREESVEFLISRTKDKNQANADKLAEELGDLPLALEQAAAFVYESGMGFNDYLNLYQTRRNELWDEENPPLGYPDTVGTTWNLAIEKVQEEAPVGALVLNLCSYFAPDGIPRSLISDASEYLPEESSALFNDSLALYKGIKVLNQYSLVNAQPDSLSVHRLVQVVVRDCLKTEEQKIWLEAAVRSISAGFPSEGYQDPKLWPECAALLSHGRVVIEHTAAIKVALETAADLLNSIASYLLGRASYADAEQLFRQALEIDEMQFEPGHPSIARSQSNLALVLKDLGELEEARDLLRQALDSDQNSFEPGHPSIAIRQSNLASVLKDLGELEEARDLLRQALDSDQNSFEPGHPSIAIRQSNLALVLQDLGELEEARDLLRQALDSDQNSFEPGHPSIAIRQSNLALVLQDLGELEEARDLLRQALDSDQNSFEPGHPSIAIRQSNLASVLKYLGELEEARDLLRQALDSDQNSFEPGHPSIARSQSNLALVLKDLGELEEARDLLRQALDSDQNSFEPGHPSIARSQSNLASVLQDLGELEEARDLLRQALDSDQNSFEPGHPSIARSQSNLASVLQDLGELEEARDLLRQALDSDQNSFEPGHPSIARSQSNLALVLKYLGELEEARDLLRQALDSDQNSFEPGHPSIAIRQSNLALVLKDLGELEEARDLLRQALDSDQNSFEPGHPSIAISQSNLALVLKDLGELEEARELIQSAYNTFLERFGEKHPNTVITKGNLESIIEKL